MIRKIYIDPKIIDMSRGITYTHPTFFERIKVFLGLMKFKPKQIVQCDFMSLIPKIPYPKPLYKIGSVTTA